MNALEIKNLTKEYKGFKLDNLNLTIPKGCICGLVGENGAGKTTTIKLILDIISRDSGEITVFGMDNIRDNTKIKQEMGVVLDQIGMPGCVNVHQISKIMEGIYDNWDRNNYYNLVKQLEIPENKAFSDFSKGMKMKLGIAVSLSHHSKLLILDEATAGLDPLAREQVVNLLRDYSQNEENSILFSSHIVSDLEKLCDYIAFLHKGKLILFDEKDSLLDKYVIIHLSREALKEVNREKILSVKENKFGAELIVKREALHTFESIMEGDERPVSVEELFLAMVKEADNEGIVA